MFLRLNQPIYVVGVYKMSVFCLFFCSMTAAMLMVLSLDGLQFANPILQFVLRNISCTLGKHSFIGLCTSSLTFEYLEKKKLLVAA